MASIGRRGFVKGATLGALAFSVGGVETIMAPNEARARNVPALICDSEAIGDINVISDSPETVPKTAGAPPR